MPGYVGYQLTENLNGSITFQYTPTTPGVHKIEIDCNGTQVEGLPLWCVVQRAEYGYMTSYGPRLLDILGQAGFAETLDAEGLVITQEGDTLSVMKREVARLAGAILDPNTEIIEADQSTTEAIQHVLDGMSEMGDDKNTEEESTVLEEFTQQKPDDEETAVEIVKLEHDESGELDIEEPSSADHQLVVNELAHVEATDLFAVGDAGSDSGQIVLDAEQGIFVQAELRKDDVPKDVQDVLTQVGLKQEQDATSETSRKELRKDKYPCPYKGCLKSYGKEIYADNCELDHFVREQRKSKRLSKLTSARKTSRSSSKVSESSSSKGPETTMDDADKDIENTADDDADITIADDEMDSYDAKTSVKDSEKIGEDAFIVNEDGDKSGEDGDKIGEDGDKIGEDAFIIDEDGDTTGEDGNKICEDGDKIGEDGDKIGEDGDKIGEDGDKFDDQETKMEVKPRRGRRRKDALVVKSEVDDDQKAGCTTSRGRRRDSTDDDRSTSPRPITTRGRRRDATDDDRSTSPRPITTRGRKHESTKSESKVSPATVITPAKRGRKPKGSVTTSDQKVPEITPIIRSGRKRKASPILKPEEEERSGTDSEEETMSSKSPGRARRSPSAEIAIVKRSRRTPKPTWKMLDSPIPIKKEKIDPDYDAKPQVKNRENIDHTHKPKITKDVVVTLEKLEGVKLKKYLDLTPEPKVRKDVTLTPKRKPKKDVDLIPEPKVRKDVTLTPKRKPKKDEDEDYIPPETEERKAPSKKFMVVKKARGKLYGKVLAQKGKLAVDGSAADESETRRPDVDQSNADGSVIGDDDDLTTSSTSEFLCKYEDCGHSFVSASKLKMHNHAIHGYKCFNADCDRMFKSSSARRKHLRRFHNGENLDKGRVFRKLDSATRLLMRKKAEERYQFECTEADCTRRFITSSVREKHMQRVHYPDSFRIKMESGEELFQCQFGDGCVRYFKSSSARSKHVRRFHEGQNIDKNRGLQYEEDGVYRGVVYKCKFIGCGHTYSNGSNLKKHIKNMEHYMEGESDEDGYLSEEEAVDSDGAPTETSKYGVYADMKVELGEQNSDLTVCHREGCGRIFKKPPQLKRHLESHNKFPFQCDKENCKKMFRFEESLSLHKFSYHGMKEELKRFECELCNKHFSSWCLLKKHQRVHTLETPYQCQDCLARFKWQTSLLTHACLNKSGEGASLKCPECDKIFNMKCLLKKHMVMHSEARPFKCDKCDKSFKMRETLQKHDRKAHTSELEKRIFAEQRGWICPQCDWVCLSYRDLDRHMTKHSDFRPYICDQCASMFKTPECLTAHIKQMHAVTLVQHEDGTVEEVRTLNYFACDFPNCEKKFRRHGTYIEHKRIHYSRERFYCDFPGCKKSYPTIYKLKEHHRTVHRERPPVFCEVCGKQMKNSSTLANHMKIHTQLSRIACHYKGCEKTFTAKATLERHILMKHQSPDKLFECTVEGCGKKFKLKCLLDQHMLSHVKEKNFQCEVCNKYFKTYNTMRTHTRIHNQVNQFECNFCGSFFSRRSRYLQHLAVQHQGEVRILTPNDADAAVPNQALQIEQVNEKGEHIQYLKPEVIQAITDAVAGEGGTYTVLDAGGSISEGGQAQVVTEGQFSGESHVAIGGQTFVIAEGTHILEEGQSHILAHDATHILSQEGGDIVSNDGTHILSQDGTRIVAHDGSHIVSDGIHIVQQDSSHTVSDGTHIVANDGSHIVSSDDIHIVSDAGGHVVSEGTHIVVDGSHILADGNQEGTIVLADGAHIMEGAHLVEESELVVDDTKPEIVYQEVVTEATEQEELIYEQEQEAVIQTQIVEFNTNYE